MTRRAVHTALILLAAFSANGCATTRLDNHVAEQKRLQAKVTSLGAALDSLQVLNDSLRLDVSRLEFELIDRDEMLLSLRRHLDRLKEIDLKPRHRQP